jgi:hypothetical protein
MNELIDNNPEVNVIEDEYKRLLGYPNGYLLEGRALELADWAAQWYKENGKPWVYARHTGKINYLGNKLVVEGIEFSSKKLRKQLSDAEVDGSMLVAVSAGRELEEKAYQLWQEGKPDEYFFLEVYGSAVVERLVTTTGARFCAWADENGSAVLPHYSPGYPGWNIIEQNGLLELIRKQDYNNLPGELQVLETGMLKPKKSLLAIFGITKHLDKVQNLRELIPCENCSLQNCQYRRKPYKFPRKQIEDVNELQPGINDESTAAKNTSNGNAFVSALTKDAKYNFNSKALQKWTNERLRFQVLEDKSIEANFKYEGTTCSNMGRTLQFDYNIKLSSVEQGYKINSLSCNPVSGDVGYTYMCEYIKFPDELMSEIEEEKPLLGQSLDDVLRWKREFDPEGCYCKPDSRKYKWGLIFEVLHFALVQSEIEGRNSVY